MTKEMTETQKVGLVRNALLVAGQEMGETGDHWPVINDTLHKIAEGWEEANIEDNVDAELKIHLYQQLETMEKNLAEHDPITRAEIGPKLKELREIYDAYFMSLDEDTVPIREDEIPTYMKRADAILSTLGESHE